MTRSILERNWVGREARRVLCVSDSVAATELELGLHPDQVVVVPNGVRIEAAWPASSARDELGLDHDTFTVGIVGRLRPEKAHEVVLEALGKLIDDGRKVQLCIVGDGPRRAELSHIAHELGISRDVVFAGEHANAARLAAAFDVGVLCSRWEGLPLAALETMAAGVPLVASAVGGLPKLLSGGVGLLVAPGDSRGFAKAIAGLQDDPAARRELAMLGERRVREEYSFRRMIRRVEGIYTAVLSEAAEDGSASSPAWRKAA